MRCIAKPLRDFIVEASSNLEHSSLIPFFLGYLYSSRISLRGRSAASLRQNCVTVFSFSKNHFSSPSGRWSIVLLISSWGSTLSHCAKSSINFSVTDTNSSRTSEAALWPSTYIAPLSNSKPCIRKDKNSSKSLDTLKVKIISVTFRRVIRTTHKKASKIWRHENIQLGGCQS